MHIHEANIANLTGLWKKYGSQPIKGSTLPLLNANTHWPHRCWFDWGTLSDEGIRRVLQRNADNNTLLDNVPESAIVPVWPMLNRTDEDEYGVQFKQQLIENLLIERKWVCGFEQIAMYLDLQERVACSPSVRIGFQVNPVHTPEEVKSWVDISSEAFAYSIDRPVIEQLINDKDIQILLGFQSGQAVASALLYKTGNIIGLHQVGVKQAFQGKGIARCFMQEIIADCVRWQVKYIVLQASQVGQPLYSRLGFREQFYIKNYRKL